MADKKKSELNYLKFRKTRIAFTLLLGGFLMGILVLTFTATSGDEAYQQWSSICAANPDGTDPNNVLLKEDCSPNGAPDTGERAADTIVTLLGLTICTLFVLYYIRPKPTVETA